MFGGAESFDPAFDPSGDLTLGVVGAGAMGRGIAQVAAEAGVRVLIADARAGAAEEARAFAAGMIERKRAKGALDAAAAGAAAGRLVATGAGVGEAGYAALAGADVVVEAVVEDLGVKHAVLRGVEAAVGDACVLATNTSSLSVSAFAAAARRPERVAGWHFFNPVPLMRLAEVIPGVLTAPGVTAALEGLTRRLGHHPVRASDAPGFLVNHAGRAFPTEGLAIVGEGVASFADVDRVMTGAAGFRMGPFELMDLTGLDVSHAVMTAIHAATFGEPRFRPSALTAPRLAAGLLGRKSGRGFYAHPEGAIARPEEPPAPAAPRGVPAWVSSRGEGGAALRAVLAAAGARVEEGARPSAGALAFVTPLGEDATAAALAEGLDPARTLAVDPLHGFAGRRTLMGTPLADPGARGAAHGLLAADGTPVTVINDSAGFIAQRVLAMIVSVGCEAAQQRVATPADVDRAVELALGYPRGPLALGDALGPARVLAILRAMHHLSGDPRHRPGPWLRRRATLGVSLTTPEP